MMRSHRSILLFLGMLISFAGGLRGDDTIESLKKEIAVLKKEVELARRERDLLQKEVDQLRSGEKAAPSEKRPEGEILGIVWEIDYLRPDGTVHTTAKFLASEGKIYHDAREIGTYSENGNRARMDITRGPNERANGVYEFLRISNNPPLYSGRMRNKKGESPKVNLRMVRD